MPFLTSQQSRLLGNRAGIATPIPMLGAELLTNGDMETGDPPATWILNASATKARAADPRTGSAGSYALELARGSGDHCAYQVPGGVSGAWYLLTGWVRNVDATRAYLYHTTPAQLVSSTTWTQCQMVMRDTGTGIVRCYVEGTTGQKARFDDVSWKRIDLVSTFAGRPQASADMDTSAPVTVVAGTRAGVFARLDSLTTPGSFLIASHDGTNARLTQATNQLLTNGGFKTAGAGGADVFGSWTEIASDGAIAATTTPGQYRTGTACRITAGAGASTYVVQTVFNVVAGQTYTVSFWARGDGTNAGRYRLWDNSNNVNIVATTATGVTGTTYTRVTSTFVAPAGCSQINLYLYCPSTNGGVAYFDDVLFSAPYPVTYTELINTAVTYVAGAAVRIWCSGTTAKLYYNGAKVGADQTVDAALTGTIFGKWNTLASNEIGACTIVPAA